MARNPAKDVFIGHSRQSATAPALAECITSSLEPPTIKAVATDELVLLFAKIGLDATSQPRVLDKLIELRVHELADFALIDEGDIAAVTAVMPKVQATKLRREVQQMHSTAVPAATAAPTASAAAAAAASAAAELPKASAAAAAASTAAELPKVTNSEVGFLPKIYTDGWGRTIQGTYNGRIVNGKAEGVGTWTGNNKWIYRGIFKNHMFHGQGTFTYANGDKYEGAFEADKMQGQCTKTFSKGDKYIGAYAADKRNGYGTYTFANGRTISGQWKDDRPVR